MMQEWEKAEFEEKIGQGAKLALMVYENPDDSQLWDKLKGWATEHKNYIQSSYEAPEEKGFNIANVNQK
jgi:hypothetical protein